LTHSHKVKPPFLHVIIKNMENLMKLQGFPHLYTREFKTFF